MTRWGKPTKNKRRRDPRYRLDESNGGEYGRGRQGTPLHEPGEEALDWSNRSGGYDDPAHYAPEASAQDPAELSRMGYKAAMAGQEAAMPEDENYMAGYQDGQRDASLERQGHGAPTSAPMYETKWNNWVKSLKK